MSRTYEAGVATAYGAALRGGYAGTYDAFCRAQADFAEKAGQVIASAQQAVDCAGQASNSRDSAAASMAAAAASAQAAGASAQAAGQSASSACDSADSAASSARAAAASEAHAAQVAASIPADYTSLCGRVSDLDVRQRDHSPAIPVGPEVMATLPDAAPLNPDALRFEIVPAQEGSGTPGPGNVRAIEGQTDMKVQLTGRNLLTGMRRSRPEYNGITYSDNGDGSIHARGTATSNAYSDVTASVSVLVNGGYPILPPGTYIIPVPNTSRVSYYVSLWDMDFNQVGTNMAINADSSLSRRTFTLERPCWVYFRLQTLTGVTVDDDVFPALYRQDYEGEWSAGTLREWTIAFPQAVHAGWVDAIEGKLNVRPYYESYAGEPLTGPWISDRDAYALGSTPTSGAQVVDLGGTPAVYDLEMPKIAPQKGFNHLWCDTGDTSVTYRADAYTRLLDMIVNLQALVLENVN